MEILAIEIAENFLIPFLKISDRDRGRKDIANITLSQLRKSIVNLKKMVLTIDIDAKCFELGKIAAIFID